MPKKTEAEKAREEAAEREAAIAEADATFREEVAKAAEKRDKAILKANKGKGGNLAEQAWNETKAEEDPLYRDAAFDHRAKLDSAVETIKATGNAGIVGLEAFEKRVLELMSEQDITVGAGALVPGEGPGRPAEAADIDEAAADAADKKSAKKGGK